MGLVSHLRWHRGANQARLAKLAAENGDDEKATALLDEAMTYLSDSGSSWSEEELRRFIDRLDEKNLESPSSQESAVASEKDENDA